MEKPIKETFVLFQVNQAQGQEKIDQTAEQMIQAANEALEKSQQIGHKTFLGISLRLMGYLAFVEGDFAGAKRYLLESVAVFSALGHSFHAIPLGILSHVFRAEGDETQSMWLGWPPKGA